MLPIFALLNLESSCGTTKQVQTDKTTDETEVVSAKPTIAFVQMDTLNEVLKKAKREKKAVFLDFYTTWCMPCRMMDESVFKDEELVDYLNQNVICMKVNAEKGNGPNLKILFGVNAYPTMIFVDTNGNELDRHEGGMSTADFKKMAKAASWKVRGAK
jgi:thiol:disulfide interchange protein